MHNHPASELLRLTINGEVMEVTPEHPIYIEGKGWVNAEGSYVVVRGARF